MPDKHSRLRYTLRGALNRCPRCGEGKILKNLFLRHEHCPHCNLQFAREDGFFSGAMPINYTLVCIFWLLPLSLLWAIGWLGDAFTLYTCVGGAIVIPVLTYRYSQCLWLGTYYYFLANDIEQGNDIREHDNSP